MLKHVGHLVAYDVRALRRPLVVWALGLAAQAAVLLLGPGRLSADPRLAPNYDLGVALVRLMLTMVLAALLVQRDPLVGTTAFWRTRPIPRVALLMSKLSAAGALLAVPAGLVILGVLLLLGVPVASAWQGAMIVAAEQAFVLLLALAMAAVTVSLAHFVIALLAGVTLVLLAEPLLPALMAAWSQVRPVVLSWNRTLFVSVVAIGAAAGLVHQCLTLRTARTVSMVALALLVATGGASLWHPDRDVLPARIVDPSVLRADDVLVELDPASWGAVVRARGSAREKGRGLSAIVRLSGEPAAILLKPAEIDATLTIPDQPPVRWRSGFASSLVSAATRPGESSQPYRSVRAALGSVDLGLPRNRMDQQYLLRLMEVGEETADALRGSPGALDAALTVRAFRYGITARAAVAPGGVLRMPGRRATIVAVGPAQPVLGMAPSAEGVNVILSDAGVARDPFDVGWPPGYYVLCNPTRRQAVFATLHSERVFRATIGLLEDPFRVSRRSLQLEYDPVQSNATFTVDQAWIQGAELLRLEPEDLGVVTRPVRIDGLKGPI